MIVIPASDTIAGVAEAASEVTCTLFLMELNASSGAQTYTKDQQQLPSSVATIYTATGDGPTFVRTIAVVNTDATNTNTFQLFAGGTAAANAITPIFTLPPSGMAQFDDVIGWRLFSCCGAVLQTTDGRYMRGSRASVTLSRPEAINSGPGVKIKGLDMALSAGTYIADYYIVYLADATTTGLSLGVNFTGAASALLGWMQYPSTGAGATTGAHSMVATGATGQMMESFGFRGKSTTTPIMGDTVGVDAAGGVMLTRIVATLVAATSGVLELWADVEAVATTGKVAFVLGTSLRVHRVN